MFRKIPKVERESGSASNSDTWGASCTWCWGRPTSPTLICYQDPQSQHYHHELHQHHQQGHHSHQNHHQRQKIHCLAQVSFQVEENQKTKILIQVWNQNQAFVKCLRPVQFLIEQSDDISSPGRLLHPRSIFGFVATSTIPLLAPPTHHSPTVGQDDCLVRILRASLAPWQQVGRFEGHTFSFSHQLHPHDPLTGISSWWFSSCTMCGWSLSGQLSPSTRQDDNNNDILSMLVLQEWISCRTSSLKFNNLTIYNILKECNNLDAQTI